MISPLRGCDWPNVIPLFPDSSYRRVLSPLPSSAHTLLGQLTGGAGSARKRLTKDSPSPPRPQGPRGGEGGGRGRPVPTQTAMALPSLRGLPLKPASHTREVLGGRWGGGTQSDDMFKGRRLRPRKMKCEIVNVCLEGVAGITELFRGERRVPLAAQ